MNLTNFVKTVSREDFGKEFRHTALWNPRLRTTGGRFFPADGHLDFNPKIYETFGVNVFRKIVRHELCHYHLYFEGKATSTLMQTLKHYCKQLMVCVMRQPCPKRRKNTYTVAKNVDKTITENAMSILKNIVVDIAMASS